MAIFRTRRYCSQPGASCHAEDPLERRTHARLACSIRRLGLLLAGVCLALALAQPAWAYHDWSPVQDHYSLTPNCQGRVDPIGVVLFGERINPWNQRDMVQFHTRWGPGDAANSQSTRDWSGFCDDMDADNASCIGKCDRHHVRLSAMGRPKYDSFAAGHAVRSASDFVVVGTPHYEVWNSSCNPWLFGLFPQGGHATQNFSAARDTLTRAMATHHPWEETWYGNNESRPQCDGWSVWGDGTVHYIFTWDPASGM